VVQGDRTAVWVNTGLDRLANRIQYVYVIPDLVVTVITLRLRRSGPATHVVVTYERTALADAAGEANGCARQNSGSGNGHGKSTITSATPALADDPARRSAWPTYPTMSSNSVPRVSWTILSTNRIEMNAQAV